MFTEKDLEQMAHLGMSVSAVENQLRSEERRVGKEC